MIFDDPVDDYDDDDAGGGDDDVFFHASFLHYLDRDDVTFDVANVCQSSCDLSYSY